MESQSNTNSSQQNADKFNSKFKVSEPIDLNNMLNVSTNESIQVATSDMVAKNEEVAKPVAKENKILDSVSENNRQIDQLYEHLLDKNWGFWERLNNRTMYNQILHVKGDLFKTTADYRLKFYKTILDSRLEFLHERCSAGISMMKGHYRHKASSFLMSKMEELSLEVKDRQINFMESMKGKYKYALTLKEYPSMLEKYTASIFDEEGRYLRFLDSTLIRFESIIEEQLKKYN
jgi:hypothetical protein